MYAGRDFAPADAVESDVFQFNFAAHPRMAEGDTLVSATWYATVAADSAVADDTPAAILSGAASVTPQATQQRIANAKEGVKYVLQAKVTTAGGNVLSLWSHLLCTAPA